jgi:hypothetical protein
VGVGRQRLINNIGAGLAIPQVEPHLDAAEEETANVGVLNKCASMHRLLVRTYECSQVVNEFLKPD